MAVNDKTIDDIATLAALYLTEEEKKQAGKDMSEIVSFFDRIKTVDTEGVEPLYRIGRESGDEKAPLRSDEAVIFEEAGKIRSQAPVMKNGMYVTPRTI
ncbi:MAG: Asp-tRNA(Asn)/Glu-tRNA(Gln) amidotransferase subunit GatC [Lachnospiraceae bacterium]|nr:Asp-tRNA(Asn)/Glu-tRNA(Gln) amidotransferase subunit GatC [Lachnospiraceae bacterium]